jgi:hypothetical protein
VINLSKIDNSAVFDTVVEVGSASSGEVIATRRTKHRLFPVRGSPDLFFSARGGNDGHVIIEIWRVTLEAG